MNSDESCALFEENYISTSPLVLVPGRAADFPIHVLRDEEFVLYARSGEHFTARRRDELRELGVEEIFIPRIQEPLYREYLSGVLGTALLDESAPVEERARLLHDTSMRIVQDAFESRLPQSPALRDSFQRVREFIAQAIEFLGRGPSLGALARLISHDYRTFSHCVHVFLYSSALLQTYGLARDELVQAGIGALLHDIGKAAIDRDILCKKGALTLRERRVVETHPAQGAALCAGLPLSTTARACILLHHEKLDGSGYPHGMSQDAVPLAVRAVTIADAYDAMTTNRPYCRAMNPFQALRIMRDEMFGEIDIALFLRFVKVLSGAAIV